MTPDYGTSARFLDGWIEAAKRIHDDAERQYLPIILMLAGDGIDGSTVTQGRYAEMRRQMVDISATMHTRMFSSIGNAAAPQAQIGIEMGNLNARHLPGAGRPHRVPHPVAGAGPGYRPQAQEG